MKLFYLGLSLLFVVSCGRKSGNTTKIGSGNYYGSGGNVIAGQVKVYAECGSTSALIQLGDMNGSEIAQQTVSSGGSFSFQVNQGQSYHLAGRTNTCVVSTYPNGTPIPSGTTTADVCLGSQCSYSKTQMTFAKNGTSSLKTASNRKFCAWKEWGCAPGLIESADSLIESHLSMSAKKETSFELAYQYANKNTWVFSTPGFAAAGWTIKVATDGTLTVEGAAYDKMVVQSQMDRSAFQFESGFCAPTGQIGAQVTEYAKLQGFSEKSTQAIAARLAGMLPEVSELCVYPQEEGRISKGLTTKATQSVELRRMWFLMTAPAKSAKKAKAAPTSAAVAKPAKNALALARKASPQRHLANSADVTIEDLGLGFLIQGK